MKRLLALFLSFALLPVFSLDAAEIYSAKRVNGDIFEFKEFTSAEDNLDVSFRLENHNRAGSVDLLYTHADKTQKIFNSELDKNESLFFPAKSKFINLSKSGLHTFIFKFDDSTQKSVSIHIAPREDNSIGNMDLKFINSLSKPIPVSYKAKKEAKKRSYD